MDLQIIDCEQGSELWYRARAGIPTASMFDAVMAKGRGGGESKARRTYMLKLIGERLTGQPMESFSNDHTERGKAMEDEARQLYALVREVEPQPVGFMRRGDAGASPDSLIGHDGLLEIKTKLPHLQLDCILANRLPPEHIAQVQGQLWISGRSWCDFISYWPGLPLFRTRVERDEAYIASIKVAVDDFLDELAATVAKINAYGRAA
jgi:hypothetical protein